ncbi:Glycine receptor subunit alpha-4 [Araneus ventricosus]|uniref:Glycine receptor subunit alpha-4 n=1 Tax=Araneus ventricosus TaxID=182803 RepID=A0A4Y2K1U8_ARAVE|nr:Glycine receptor subunit alpha-4 [Araneus ventricosus]
MRQVSTDFLYTFVQYPSGRCELESTTRLLMKNLPFLVSSCLKRNVSSCVTSTSNNLMTCSTLTQFSEDSPWVIISDYYTIQNLREPLQMTFKFYISAIDEINESDMDFELKGYVSVRWEDYRLNCSNICPISNYVCTKFLWTPNMVYADAKQIRTSPEREIMFIIRPPTEVSYTLRYRFKIGCKMYFGDYPFDTQRCRFSIQLLNCGNTSAHLHWNMEGDAGAVSVLNKITLPQFYLRTPYGSERIVRGVKHPNHILDVNIILVRRLTGSIINIYAPSSLITAVSWVTFWLRLEAAPARVSLSITSLLTLCTQVQFNKNQLPPLNYITAVDIWLFVCIFLVFSTLVEFAISYNTYKKTKTSTLQDFKSQGKTKQIITCKMWILQADQEGSSLQNSSPPPSTAKRISEWLCATKSDDISRIDVACRKIFPLSFFLFAIVYWIHYMNIYRRE